MVVVNDSRKCDRLEPSQQPREVSDEIERAPGLRVPRVFTSATQGQGLERLREAIAHAVAGLNDAPQPQHRADEAASADAGWHQETPGKKSMQA